MQKIRFWHNLSNINIQNIRVTRVSIKPCCTDRGRLLFLLLLHLRRGAHLREVGNIYSTSPIYRPTFWNIGSLEATFSPVATLTC